MVITKKSQLSGKTHSWELNITQEQLDLYNEGKELIQNIFPHLTAPEREFLMTGIMPNEWDKIFGSADEY